MRTYIR
jgi:cell division septum initiation protein DivIVA